MRRTLFGSLAVCLALAVQGQTLPPTSQSQTVCSGTSATLTATSSQAGVTFSWWDAPTAGTLLGTGATYTTAPLSAGTIFYVQAELNGVPSLRTSVATSVANVPTIEATQDTVYACSGDIVALDATLKLNIGQVTWYDAATAGNLLASGNTYVLPSVPSGTTSYFAQGAIGNCINPVRAEVVVINVDGSITPTIAPTSFTTCFDQPVTLTGTSNVPGFDVQWWTDSVGGNLIGIGSSVTFTPQASLTVYADIELRNIVCQDVPRVPVDVTVIQQLPSPVNVTCAQVGPYAITFAWWPVTGATGYEVSLDGGATWIPANSPPTSHIVTGLSQSTAQTLRVRALDGINNCPPGKASSDKICFTADCGPLNVSVPPSYGVCRGDEVTVVISGLINDIHRVSLNGQIYNQNTFTFLPTADMTINFIVYNYIYPECDSAILTTTISVYDVPTASPTATMQDSAYPGATVNTYLFEANSSPNVTGWNWDFGDGTNATTENATHEYGAFGSYTVTLTVTTDDGCTATFTLSPLVEVFEVPDIFIPNSFTPNEDGNNDVLYVYGEYVNLDDFIIFNQYGNEVFRTSDINVGWDGSWKGVQQPGGV